MFFPLIAAFTAIYYGLLLCTTLHQCNVLGNKKCFAGLLCCKSSYLNLATLFCMLLVWLVTVLLVVVNHGLLSRGVVSHHIRCHFTAVWVQLYQITNNVKVHLNPPFGLATKRTQLSPQGTKASPGGVTHIYKIFTD